MREKARLAKIAAEKARISKLKKAAAAKKAALRAHKLNVARRIARTRAMERCDKSKQFDEGKNCVELAKKGRCTKNWGEKIK